MLVRLPETARRVNKRRSRSENVSFALKKLSRIFSNPPTDVEIREKRATWLSFSSNFHSKSLRSSVVWLSSFRRFRDGSNPISGKRSKGKASPYFHAKDERERDSYNLPAHPHSSLCSEEPNVGKKMHYPTRVKLIQPVCVCVSMC